MATKRTRAKKSASKGPAKKRPARKQAATRKKAATGKKAATRKQARTRKRAATRHKASTRKSAPGRSASAKPARRKKAAARVHPKPRPSRVRATATPPQRSAAPRVAADREDRPVSSARVTEPRESARRRFPALFADDADEARGLGPESGGQSGDIEGLPRGEVADSESVEELAEEGQAFEAGIVDAVENAPEGELRTREVPEDDVPQEYLDEE